MKILQLQNNINLKHNYSLFCFQPIENGFGLTLANSLSRTLENDIFGTTVTGIYNDNIFFNSKNNLFKEDILEIMFNIKNIVLRSNFFVDDILTIPLTKKKIYTTNDIFLFNKNIKVIDKSIFLFTLMKISDINVRLRVETGKGAKLNDDTFIEDNFVPIDSVFTPVIKTNYKIKLIPFSFNGKEKLKESLFFELWTNKSISSKRALYESIKILSSRFVNLLFEQKEEVFEDIRLVE